MKKILFFAESLKGGGKERRMGELIRSLKYTGDYKIFLVLYEDIFDYKYMEKSIDGKYIINRKGSRYETFRGLYNYIKEINPEIVHVWTIRVCLYLNIIRLLVNFKYIISSIADANKDSIFISLLYKLTFPLCDVITSNSQAGFDIRNAPFRKSVVIYNGFNIDRLNQNETGREIKNEFNLQNSRVITMVARMEPSKDFKMFLDVAKIMSTIRNDVVFMLVGKGSMEKELKEYSHNNDINNVVFCGFRTDVEAIYKASDVAVLCTNSDVHAEGISNSIMEAMACGVPVIATSGGGTDEIIKNNYNGCLVAPKDVNKMCEYINSLLNNNGKKEQLSENALTTIRKDFTMDKMLKRFLELYNNL